MAPKGIGDPMKKKAQKLTLSRETLRGLALPKVIGGGMPVPRIARIIGNAISFKAYRLCQQA